MKKIYLLILLCTCFTFSIFANGIEIDGIYYLLDNTNYTASVTYTGSSNSNNSYMGEVFIPSSVDYNSHVYIRRRLVQGYSHPREDEARMFRSLTMFPL